MSVDTTLLKESEWLDQNNLEAFQRYKSLVGTFITLEDRKHCHLWLSTWIDTKALWVVENTRLTLPLIRIYDVKLGDKNGIRVGFLFRSPLPFVKADSYLIFYRSSIPVDIGTDEAVRRYVVGQLLFFELGDNAVMISGSPPELLQQYLEE